MEAMDKINSKEKEKVDIACITDVRYNNHRRDEVSWLHSHHGFLIYISQLVPVDGQTDLLKPLSPHNEEEMMNDPAVREGSDCVAEIKNATVEKLPEVLEEKVQEVIKWLTENGGGQWRQLLTQN